MTISARFSRVALPALGIAAFLSGIAGCAQEKAPESAIDYGKLLASKPLNMKKYSGPDGNTNIYTFIHPENPNLICITKGSVESSITCLPKP